VLRASTLLLSAAILALGVAIVVSTVARGGGPLSVGIVVGLLFCALGAGRLWMTTRSRG
jgi:hypothetical protein